MKKMMSAVAVAAALLAVPQSADASGGCPHYHGLLAAEGLPVSTFSRIMFRESRCQPGVRSRTRDTGLLQINDVVLKDMRLRPHLYRGVIARYGLVTQGMLRSPEVNVAVAGALYRSQGLRPWRSTR